MPLIAVPVFAAKELQADPEEPDHLPQRVVPRE